MEYHAFTLIELMVVVACVALVAAILLSAMAKDKAKAQRAQCQSRLPQIGLACRTWEGDHGDKYPMSVSTNKGGSMEWGAGGNMFRHFQVMAYEINYPEILVCPSDDRQVADSFTNMNNQNVSYFVGLDADETMPAMLLSGDRNLITNGVPIIPGLVVTKTGDTVEWSGTMHKFQGNVGLADGSVQQVSSAGLQRLLQRSGTNVIRLAIP